jgi:hypothetical protein
MKLVEWKVIEDKVERVIARAFGGVHNVPSWKRRQVCTTTGGLKISIPAGGSMATYDGDYLTRLVIAAHDECVRFEIIGGTHGYMTCWFHVREGRVGASMWQRHPTMEEALGRIRKHYDMDGNFIPESSKKEV